jgi:hypothetical protein
MIKRGKSTGDDRNGASWRRVSGAARRTRLLAVALLLSAGADAPVSLAAQGTGADADARLDLLFGEHDPYRNFFYELQAAVAAHAREQVAAMISYPLKARVHGRVLQLRNPQQFDAHYDELLPPKTQDLIAQQSFDSLFANSQGVMIGNGQIWFAGVCTDELCSARPIRIIAFNP